MAKSTKRRRLRRWMVLGVLLSLLAFCVVSWFVGGRLVAPANCAVGPPPEDLPVAEATIASDSDSTLAAWYVPAERAKATIVLVHGLRGNRRSMLKRARLFHEAGYAVVMIDLQAHGESAGKHITVGHLERHDVRAAVGYARTENPRHRIAVVGCSLGGAAALLGSPLEIDALVLEGVYPTVSEAVHNRIAVRLGPLAHVLSPALLWQLRPRLCITPSDLRPIDHIADVGCPVLVAGGDLDQHTTLAETQRLFDAAREPKQLIIFEGAAHTDLLDYDPKRYESEMLPFLDTHLAPPQAPSSATGGDEAGLGGQTGG